MEEKKNAKQIMQELMDQYYEIGSVASATECTGMMYAPPRTKEELDSYAAIDRMPKPSDIVAGRKKASEK